MYCLITASVAPPTVETKYEFVQSVGSLVVRCLNSLLNMFDEVPLTFLMNL